MAKAHTDAAVPSTYLVALGGNVRTRAGRPRDVLETIVLPGEVARSGTVASRPHGPSWRCYANAVAVVESDLSPPALLAVLKQIEAAHGRLRGRRWGPRPIDLDIIGWSGGIWTSPGLTVPHPGFRRRRFVLDPLVELAPGWRDPVTGLTARQLRARLRRRMPV